MAGYRCVPEPGQVLLLDAAACPAVGGRGVRLRLTRPVRAWEADGAGGGDPRRATWWLVTGWQLGRRGGQVALRIFACRKPHLSDRRSRGGSDQLGLSFLPPACSTGGDTGAGRGLSGGRNASGIHDTSMSP